MQIGKFLTQYKVNKTNFYSTCTGCKSDLLSKKLLDLALVLITTKRQTKGAKQFALFPPFYLNIWSLCERDIPVVNWKLSWEEISFGQTFC